MTITNGEVFVLNTKNLTYIFHVDKTGLLMHDYFGSRIEINDFNIDAIEQKVAVQKGTSVIYKKEINPDLSMDYTLLEFSFPHKGDYRSTPVLLKSDKAGYTFDFNYEKYELRKSQLDNSELPAPHDHDEELVVTLTDSSNRVDIDKSYKSIKKDINNKSQRSNKKEIINPETIIHKKELLISNIHKKVPLFIHQIT